MNLIWFTMARRRMKLPQMNKAPVFHRGPVSRLRFQARIAFSSTSTRRMPKVYISKYPGIVSEISSGKFGIDQQDIEIG